MKSTPTLLLLFVLTMAIFNACGRDDDDQPASTLELSFFALHQDQPLVMFNHYDYPGINFIRYTNFRFYISDVSLIGDAHTVELTDVAMLDFRNNHADEAGTQVGEQLVFTDIDPGTYHTLRFGIGLTAELNATNPAQYPMDHPLGYMGNYWPWRETYIFVVLEAQVATEGSSNVDIYPTYHTGSDLMYYTVEVPVNLNLAANGTTGLALEIDMVDVFQHNGEPLDITTHNFTHTGPDDAWLADLITNNLAHAIRIKEQ